MYRKCVSEEECQKSILRNLGVCVGVCLGLMDLMDFISHDITFFPYGATLLCLCHSAYFALFRCVHVQKYVFFLA